MHKRSASSVLLLCVSIPVAATASKTFAATNVTTHWLTGVTGSWTTPSNWSSNPYYPNVNNPTGTTYNAVIDASSKTAYTVTLSGSTAIDVANLTINSSTATFTQSAGLTVDNQVTVTAGAFSDYNGFALSNLTVGGTSAGSFGAVGTLTNITVQPGPTVRLGGTLSNLTLAGGPSIWPISVPRRG